MTVEHLVTTIATLAGLTVAVGSMFATGGPVRCARCGGANTMVLPRHIARKAKHD